MPIENGDIEWRFGANEKINTAAGITIRGVLSILTDSLNPYDTREVISLGQGDPSAYSCFRTTQVAEDAVVGAVRSANYNCYSPTVGILPARSAIAEYLSEDLPYKLSPEDVFLTIGCEQAIEVVITVLARPGANILLPRPGYPYYEARASFDGLEVRHFDLLPYEDWEVDLNAVEALADENTVAIVIINPGNPCGSVYSYQHLKQVAETARRLGIVVIADEVYGHLTFGSKPFVPLGVFGSIAPVLTLGSISKRWIVPGWRLGWLATTDPNGFLKKSKIADCITGCLNISCDPITFVQAAVPNILRTTEAAFFNKIRILLRQSAKICYDGINDTKCITCPHKPEGSMFLMAKLNISLLEDISNDLEFCVKLATEESVIVMPGSAVGMKNWMRITFGIDASNLIDGLERLKSFCQRHAKKIEKSARC